MWGLDDPWMMASSSSYVNDLNYYLEMLMSESCRLSMKIPHLKTSLSIAAGVDLAVGLGEAILAQLLS